MSAQRLCEAAKVLRQRAEAATPGPWRAMEYDNYPGDEGVALLGSAATVIGSHMIGYFHVGGQAQMEADGALAATMHPGVALALADWLDEAGADYFAFGDDEHHAADHEPCDECDSDPRAPHLRRALRVADLILGDQP